MVKIVSKQKVFEQAVCDFYRSTPQGSLLIHNKYGDPEEMPLDVYFRDESGLSDLEDYALQLCEGRVLDVGAGLGALSLILQNRNHHVEALEISADFSSIMAQRGLKTIHQEDFLHWAPKHRYDTLLFMMNGLGFIGSTKQLPAFFGALDRHLMTDGQVIIDSSDVSYLYDGLSMPTDHYYGEIDYRYEYAGALGPWFKWLYLDAATFAKAARAHGFESQLLFTEATGQYLARLTRG